jgi:hypothetical protein
MANISTSAQAENAQKVMVAAARYTREHNAVAYNLITKMELPKGHRSVQAPKVGAFTFSDLTEGEDMTDEQQVNIRTVELTVKEVGAKVILSDVLLDQNATTPIMSIVGRQAANGFARKSDTDVTALYAGLNGGTAFGGAADSFVVSNAAAVILRCQGKTEPFDPDYVVQHPYQYFPLLRSATIIGGTNLNPPPGRQEKLMNDFFRWSLNGVDFYQDGNLTIDSSGDVTGVIAAKDAMVALEAKEFGLERERDASLRAWELNWVARYNVFELDDSHGAPLLYDAAVPNDTNDA